MKTAYLKCIALAAIGIAATMATQTPAQADGIDMNYVSVGDSDTPPRPPRKLGLRGQTRAHAAGTQTVERQDLGLSLRFTPVVRFNPRVRSIR
jgi:hypothetical protein